MRDMFNSLLSMKKFDGSRFGSLQSGINGCKRVEKYLNIRPVIVNKYTPEGLQTILKTLNSDLNKRKGFIWFASSIEADLNVYPFVDQMIVLLNQSIVNSLIVFLLLNINFTLLSFKR
uniref:Uncharacterized protein n=1 Tax=Lepeophtheirus salmonis TaxID=72036 RepID=A0A0K2V7A4_LEPSM